MNRLLLLCLPLGLASVCLGQEVLPNPSCEVQPQNPSCTTRPVCRNPHCTKCRPKICVNVPNTIRIERSCDKPCDKPPERGAPPPPDRGAPPPEENGGGLQETGAYIAPPRSGSTRGATNFHGIDGGSITLPEIRLRFPCIELPACFKSRTSARMHIDSAVAPWESHGYVQTGVSAGDAALRQRIAALEEELKKNEDKGRGASPGDGADRAAIASEAAAKHAKDLEEYKDLLKECEEEQKRLRECIESCLKQHSGHGAGERSIKTAPGAKGNPQQAPIQAPHSSFQSPDVDGYGPRPIPTESRVRRVPPVEFEETPASYVSEPNYPEPRRLIKEPQPVATLRPIREPQAPAAKITGFRPAR